MNESTEAARILAINTGSSSLKAGIYRQGKERRLEAKILIDLGGRAGGHVAVHGADGATLIERREPLADHAAALDAFSTILEEADLDSGIAAIGHRIVHGGRDQTEPKLINSALLKDLRALVPLAPEHMPQALSAVEALGRAFPNAAQVACFDTAFHRTMPRVAQLYGLPFELQDANVLRYGFHGLSCESIVHQLAVLGEIDGRRVVIAHLGNGSSMTAVHDGRGVETTMGFTPAGGLVMATRSGDLDPGVLLYLIRERGMDTASIAELVNRRAGMLGLSGVSGDMRQVLDLEHDDPRAADAVAVFCHHARKHLGGLVAVLGGIDSLVFTGGVGEHAAPIRERICDGLAHLGIQIDPIRNREHSPLISPADGPVKVRILPTDEEDVIVRHTARLLRTEGGSRVPI